MLCLLAYTATFTVYQVTFPMAKTSASATMFWIDFVVMLFFFTDILMNLNLVYTAGDGTLVMSRSKIIAKYARGWLSLDLLSTIPWDLMGTGTGARTRLVRLLRLVKLLRLMRASRVVLSVMKSMRSVKMSDWLYLKKLVMALLFTHWIACLWWLLGSSTDNLTADFGHSWLFR